MHVAAAQNITVQSKFRIAAHGQKKIFHQFAGELAGKFIIEIVLEMEKAAPAKVDNRTRERFIQRDVGDAKAADSGFIAERLRERRAQAYAHVFNGMMKIHSKIALGFQLQINERMRGEEIEHVIEEADARGNARFAAALEIERERDIRFVGSARDLCGAIHGLSLLLSHSPAICHSERIFPSARYTAYFERCASAREDSCH